MKIGIVLVLIVLGAGIWFLWQGSTPAENMKPMGEAGEEANHMDTEADGAMGEDSAMSPKPDAMEEPEVMEETSEAPEETNEATTRVFDMDGFNFGYSVTEMRVKEGDTVTVNLTSTDGVHDWVVDEFEAATGRVNTGGATSVTFVASAAGTYEYYCSVGNHRQLGMVGTLIVE